MEAGSKVSDRAALPSPPPLFSFYVNILFDLFLLHPDPVSVSSPHPAIGLVLRGAGMWLPGSHAG